MHMMMFLLKDEGQKMSKQSATCLCMSFSRVDLAIPVFRFRPGQSWWPVGTGSHWRRETSRVDMPRKWGDFLEVQNHGLEMQIWTRADFSYSASKCIGIPEKNIEFHFWVGWAEGMLCIFGCGTKKDISLVRSLKSNFIPLYLLDVFYISTTFLTKKHTVQTRWNLERSAGHQDLSVFLPTAPDTWSCRVASRGAAKKRWPKVAQDSAGLSNKPKVETAWNSWVVVVFCKKILEMKNWFFSISFLMLVSTFGLLSTFGIPIKDIKSWFPLI